MSDAYARVLNSDVDERIQAEYTALLVEKSLRYEVEASWHTEAVLDLPNDVLWQHTALSNKDEALFWDGEALVWVRRYNDGSVYSAIAAAERAVADAATANLRSVLPEIVPEEGHVSLRFWYLTQHGPGSVERRIAVPKWDDITLNYGGDTRDALAHLMTEFRPSHGGQIILWQGVPGTGKTYALRALFKAWQDWCKPEYVVDPDNLFGNKAAYLMSLLVRDSDDDDEEKWRLLVLEDASELIAPDAKQVTGQGLSRLLNLTDGLIGQGLRILVLITTNDEVKELHPAISRPGRSAAVVRFNPLSEAEVADWVVARGIDRERAGGQSTLAELYAAYEAEPALRPAERRVGFAPLSSNGNKTHIKRLPRG